MSIAEKLTTIAENEQKVYEAGQETENRRYWERFWEGLKNPNTGNYNLRHAFSGGGWNEETFSKIVYPSEKLIVTGASSGLNAFQYFNRDYVYNNPMIDLADFCRHVDFSGLTSANYIFHNAIAKNITIDLGNCTNITYAFSGDNGGNIENLTLKITSKCTTFTNAFYYMKETTTIRFTDDSEIVSNVSFAQSSKLTYESLRSIINALGTVSSTKTLTLHATAKAKLTEADIAEITQKGWTLA